MEKVQANALTRTEAMSKLTIQLILAAIIFLPSLWLIENAPMGSQTPDLAPIADVSDVLEFALKPKPKQLVEIYSVFKKHRPDVEEKEAWRVADVIFKESRRYQIDPALVLAVIHVESRFRFRAISPVGARGIMQIMPDTGRLLSHSIGKTVGLRPESFRPEYLDDPIVNIKMGIRYLHDLNKHFRDLKLALIAYNAGPSEIQNRLDNNLEFPEDYAILVRAAYQSYSPTKRPMF